MVILALGDHRPGAFSCRVCAANCGRGGLTVADGDRCAGTGKAGSTQASSLRNRGFRWLLRGDRRSSTTDRKGFRKPMLYPLSYEGGPAVLRGPEPTVLALVRGFGLGRSVHGWRRGQCLMVVVGSESGGDAVIDFSFLSVDTVGVDLQQHGHVMAEPPGDLGGGHAAVGPQRGRRVRCRTSLRRPRSRRSPGGCGVG